MTTAAKPQGPDTPETSCDKGNGTICFELGLKYEPDGPAHDAAKAAGFFGKACENSHGLGCVYAADGYVHGDGVTRDDARAQALYARAATLLKPECGRADAVACHALGMLYLTGRGVAQDNARARRYLDTACRAGNRNACAAARRAARPPETAASPSLRTRPRPRP